MATGKNESGGRNWKWRTAAVVEARSANFSTTPSINGRTFHSSEFSPELSDLMICIRCTLSPDSKIKISVLKQMARERYAMGFSKMPVCDSRIMQLQIDLLQTNAPLDCPTSCGASDPPTHRLDNINSDNMKGTRTDKRRQNCMTVHAVLSPFISLCVKKQQHIFVSIISRTVLPRGTAVRWSWCRRRKESSGCPLYTFNNFSSLAVLWKRLVKQLSAKSPRSVRALVALA